MTNKKGTKRALLASLVSLLLCFSMLIGTTYAWFTDSVKSTNNIITAGNLDIELEFAKVVDGKITDWDPVKLDSKIFDENALWEPGRVEIAYLRISNLGTLALKYQLNVNVENETEGTNLEGKTFKLSDHLVFKAIEMPDGLATFTDREAVQLAAGTAKGLKDYDGKTTALDPASTDPSVNDEDYVALIIYMPESVGNEANYRGTAIPQISLGVNLFATQLMNESDSFGPDYDADAMIPWDGSAANDWFDATKTEFVLYTPEDMAGFAALVYGGNNFAGKTVKLAADINLGNRPWTPIGRMIDTSGVGENSTFKGNFDGQGHTIYNLNVDTVDAIAGDDTNKGAGLFGAVTGNISNVNIKNATITTAHWAGAIAGNIQGSISKCSVEDVTIVCLPELIGSDWDNGDKAGAIVGYATSGTITDCTVKNATITAYRQLGAIVGGSYNPVSGCTVSNVTLIKDNSHDYKVTDDDNTVNAYVGTVYGGATVDATGDVTITSTATVATIDSVNEALKNNDPTVTLSGCEDATGVITIPASYTGTLTVKDSKIAAINALGDANIVIEGDVQILAGNAPATMALTTNSTDTPSSAITANGKLNISGKGSLIAVAADTDAAFGIGGMNVTEINIKDVTIAYVSGGHAYGVGSDTKYYKDAPEGGAAIGSGYNGAVITLENVSVVKAIGGSKAAAIGARYHVGVNVNIIDSTIAYAEGGVSAAAIGGSRISNGATEAGTTINIKDSTVTAKGGAYGAGIGSGYDTHCQASQPMCTINIEGSTINAEGGKYAAGIGTGYHHAALSGEIKDSTVIAKSGEKFYKHTYITAMDIGFGVTDPAREGQQTDSYIIYNGNKITANDAVAFVKDGTQLVEALNAGIKKVLLTDDVQWGTALNKDATIDLAGNKFEAMGAINLGNNADLTMSGGDYVVNGTYGHVDVRPSTAEGSVVTFEDVDFSFNKLSPTYGPSTNRLGSVVEVCATVTDAHTKIIFKNCTFTNAQVIFEGLSGTTGTFEAEFINCTFNALTSSAPIYVQNYVKGTIKVTGCTFNLECTSSTASAISVSPSTSTAVTVTAENNTLNATAATPTDSSVTGNEVVKVNGTPQNIKLISIIGSTSSANETGTIKTGIAA